LGVVSERGERSSSRRVRVDRRCEFSIDGTLYPASIEDVSVRGARVNVFSKDLTPQIVGSSAEIRFQPYGRTNEEAQPVTIRNLESSGDITALGCQYVPKSALDHRLIADLIFANSEQWTQFQRSRRRNPGIIRGTIWFLGLSLYQTSRGLVYL